LLNGFRLAVIAGLFDEGLGLKGGIIEPLLLGVF
jgi:hypothetical protein